MFGYTGFTTNVMCCQTLSSVFDMHIFKNDVPYNFTNL